MTDSRQFGSARGLQFGDAPGAGAGGGCEDCARCEAMLADAVDGTLSAEEQEVFDGHMAKCGPCAQVLADARRGVAWLEMLRRPAPEPPADLAERILARTSWVEAAGIAADAAGIVPAGVPYGGFGGAGFAHGREGVAALAAGYVPARHPGYAPAGAGNVLPFPRRAVAAIRRSSFGQIALQPRLAMTAAMAFFSIALTMNITGFHPTSLRASDLQPDNLRHDFYSNKARVVRYYEGLRVVYELESRVRDLQSVQEGDAAADQSGAPAPAAQPASQPGSQPDGVDPNTAPQQDNQPGSSQPGTQRTEPKKPAVNPGTSLREELNRSRLSLAEAEGSGCGNDKESCVERRPA